MLRGSVSDGECDHSESRKCHALGGLPVGLIKDDEFLAARGKGNFFLGKAFDAVTDHIDTLSPMNLVSFSVREGWN